MSYRKFTTPVLDSKTGFDKASKEYRTYRDHLTSVDTNRFLRFLPRKLTEITILDLWCGDGRIFDHFKNIDFGRYIALDNSEEMLKAFRSSQVEKICADCSLHIPLDDETVDLTMAFFLFEYITDLDNFFQEVYRVMRPWATFIASYFFQRNAFVFWHGDESFKIGREAHTYEEIAKAAEYAFFSVEAVPLIDQHKIMGNIYVFTK